MDNCTYHSMFWNMGDKEMHIQLCYHVDMKHDINHLNYIIYTGYIGQVSPERKKNQEIIKKTTIFDQVAKIN